MEMGKKLNGRYKIIGTVVVIHLKAINQNQVKQIEDELNKTIFQTQKENI